MKRTGFYILLSAACITGMLWIFINLNIQASGSTDDIGVCLIKHNTGIPCPSCGSTRSIVSLLQGNFSEAIYWNPIGLILFLIISIAPLWIIFDLMSKRSGLYNFYLKAEQALKKFRYAVPAILLVLVNWIWNIYKGL